MDRRRRARARPASTRTCRSAASASGPDPCRQGVLQRRRISSAAARATTRRCSTPTRSACRPPASRRTRCSDCSTSSGARQSRRRPARSRRNRLSDNGSLFGSVDFAPPTSTSGQRVQPHVQRQLEPADAVRRRGDASSRRTSGERTNWSGGVQGTSQRLLRLRHPQRDVARRRAAQELRRCRTSTCPAARVRVNSTFADGASGVQTLAFGGNQATEHRASRRPSCRRSNQLSWFSDDNKHRLKLTTRAASR